MNKLTASESERVLHVFDETLRQMTLLSILPTSEEERDDDDEGKGGARGDRGGGGGEGSGSNQMYIVEDFTPELRNHLQLQKKYTQHFKSLTDLGPARPDEPSVKAAVQRVKTSGSDLRKHTVALCRLIDSDQELEKRLSNLKEHNFHVATNRYCGIPALQSTIASLKLLVEAQFKTTVEQDVLTNEQAVNLARKERELEKIKGELHNDLARRITEREIFQQQSNDTVAKVRSEIEDLRKQSGLKRQKLERTMKVETSKSASLHSQAMTSLQENLGKISGEY